MKQKLAKIIRVLTIAPIGALYVLTLLYITQRTTFGSLYDYITSIAYLVILPVLGYPLQRFIPPFKNHGREGQRNLAIVMAVIGYICGIITSILTSASDMLMIIYLTYLISGIVLMLVNKLLKYKASGHACGIVGAVSLASYFSGINVLIVGAVIYTIVFISSLYMKRHSIMQYITGSLISLCGMLISVLTV